MYLNASKKVEPQSVYEKTYSLGQVENSESSEFCFRLNLFCLFDFDLKPKIENSEEENSGKKFRTFRGFRVFDLPLFIIFHQVSQI